ncbi:DUF3055 domain-containing protein [Sediminibacillus massiliensis]|uniref:DUF3055 domain-containing protein n=1 Tax=Sediminibacillus massiliensis TaxID=1926277 RepID=UPI000988946A|nr:DUF3055 domain-containing protein [Sediminibacillus massiliensis]
MSDDRLIINDESETVQTRFISFKGDNHRYDLAIVSSERFNDKKMILDLNGRRFEVLNEQEIKEEGILEHAFNLSEIKAAELRKFLLKIF